MPAHRTTICALALIFGFPGLGDGFGRPTATAQGIQNAKHVDPLDRFAQIDARLPTPGPTRTASGAPGPAYWQQRVDYQIDATLNDDDQSIRGTCRIAYHNHSPHPLRYLWLQLDQNRFHPDSAAVMTQTAPSFGSRMSFGAMRGLLAKQVFDGGFKIDAVRYDEQADLPHTIVDTMMRVDLPDDLMPGQSIRFSVEYHYNIIETKVIGGRGGFESFDDGNRIYEIAQWYPRLTAYTDYCGWQHKQFLGRGEFTLELGDYRVRLTVSDDMVVAATGTLQNPDQVYRPAWKQRLKQATKSDKPVFIVTPDEARANESADPSKNLQTWDFHADNVRDFAFAASRKFIWDAMETVSGDQSVMAMSFYPNEAEPLWSQYSTEAIVHTLDVYGRYAFHYPYPTAISVNGPVYGMEYPMICFNGPRPEKDGTYSKATKYGLISVIIHEVGHNFFPMIVNSDERQWTWMDEGLNTFLQYLTEQEWEEDYPSRRGEPEKITGYMKGGNQRAIMTGSEEILQFGANAYAKPATALNILRETILGRELFDFAFREYCRRWRFKRPTPADFFRTMEDASATDLDWFWHGWFYTTDHVDIAITDLQLYTIDDGDPDDAADRRRDEKAEKEPTLSEERNAGLRRRIDWQPGLKDYYNSPDYDPDGVDEDQRKAFHKMIEGLDDRQRAMLRSKSNFYVATFENVGGLVMPIIVRLYFDDGSNQKVTVPAQIWRANSRKVRKLFITEKSILRIEVDPQRQTADVDLSNNHFPPRVVPSRFQLYKSKSSGKNPMQKAGLGKKESDKPKADDAKEKQDDASE